MAFSIKKFFTEHDVLAEDLSFLGTDLHSHLIPGIDDGSPDLSVSLTLIREMHALGYRKIITTPHVMQGSYPNDASTILPGLELLRSELERLQIPVKLDAAAEYLLDSGIMEMLDRGESLLTLSGKKILVEMSFVAPPLMLHEMLYRLRLEGYEPVIAHPERYKYYHRDFKQYEKMLDLGCGLQLNLLSLTGHYGKEVKKTALKLLDRHWLSYLGTDLHNQRHVEGLRTLVKDRKLIRLLKTLHWKNHNL